MILNRFKTPAILIAMFVLFDVQAMAQHKQWGSNLLLEGRVNYGFMINHHLEMKIFNAHFPSFELNLGKETYGPKRWQVMFGYPVIDVSYWYSQLGSSTFLGSTNAVFPYVNYPVIRNRNNELNLRIGAGLAYLSERFDRLENYKYIDIGSHMNAAVNMMAEYRRRFNPRTNAAVGIAFMHFPNGSTKTPNYGMNTPSVNLAIKTGISKLSISRGSADMTIKGNTGLNFIYSGAYGAFRCLELNTVYLYIQNKSPNDYFVNVSHHMEYNISGLGTIYYRGNPPEIT